MNSVDTHLPKPLKRVLLVDDHSGLRSAMRLLLELETGIEVAGELADAHNLPALVRELKPDLLLLDWELQELRPGRARRQLINAVRTAAPGVYIIGLCSCQAPEQQFGFNGVDAFVSKAEPPECLLAAIRRAALQIADYQNREASSKRQSKPLSQPHPGPS